MGIVEMTEEVVLVSVETEVLNAKQLEALDKIRVILKRQGVNMSVKAREISFFMDKENVEKKRTRGAGPNKRFLNIRLSEVESLVKEIGTEEAYRKLGISRATFYRRMNAAIKKRKEGVENPFL